MSKKLDLELINRKRARFEQLVGFSKNLEIYLKDHDESPIESVKNLLELDDDSSLVLEADEIIKVNNKKVHDFIMLQTSLYNIISSGAVSEDDAKPLRDAVEPLELEVSRILEIELDELYQELGDE